MRKIKSVVEKNDFKQSVAFGPLEEKRKVLGATDPAQVAHGANADRMSADKSSGPEATITISDRVYLDRSEIPESVLQALQENLIFDNPLYLKNLKFGRPCGNLSPRLACIWEAGATLSIARGFTSELIALLHAHRISFEIKDLTRAFPLKRFAFIGHLNEAQLILYDKFDPKRYGIIAAPPGMGKRKIALKLVADRKVPALVIVRTKRSLYQWKALVGKFLGIDGTDVGLIGDGHHRIGDQFTIAIDRSLYRWLDDLIPQIGFLIVDRCHSANLKIFYDATLRFRSTYILGLADMARRSDKLTELMHAFLGPLRGEVDFRSACGGLEGNVPRVEIMRTAFDFDYKDNFGDLISTLCNDELRNDLICKDILQQTAGNRRLGLVISERRRHLKALKSILANSAKRSEIITGKTSRRKRHEIVARAEQKELSVILVTQKCLASVKLPPVKTLFIACPFKSKDHLFEAINKLKVAPQARRPAIIYEYYDQPGVLKASFNSRLRVYRSIGASIDAL